MQHTTEKTRNDVQTAIVDLLHNNRALTQGQYRLMSTVFRRLAKRPMLSNKDTSRIGNRALLASRLADHARYFPSPDLDRPLRLIAVEAELVGDDERLCVEAVTRFGYVTQFEAALAAFLRHLQNEHQGMNGGRFRLATPTHKQALEYMRH